MTQAVTQALSSLDPETTYPSYANGCVGPSGAFFYKACLPGGPRLTCSGTKMTEEESSALKMYLDGSRPLSHAGAKLAAPMGRRRGGGAGGRSGAKDTGRSKVGRCQSNGSPADAKAPRASYITVASMSSTRQVCTVRLYDIKSCESRSLAKEVVAAACKPRQRMSSIKDTHQELAGRAISAQQVVQPAPARCIEINKPYAQRTCQ